MTLKRSLSAGLFGVLLATGRVQAQVAPAEVGAPARYQAAISWARQFIQDTMKVLGAPGASITVLKDGRTVWSEGFGMADVEQQVPATPLTRFRIGSVSKPLTAAALGLLVEEGKLDLDAPVQKYVPTFPTKPWPITVRQVAGHLSGIRHYKPHEFESQRHYATVLEGLTIFQDDSLLFQPGTKYLYSTFGWNLLSAVVEGASGQSFLTFMSNRVFGPAGMTHTVAEFPDSIIPFRSRFYVRPDSNGGMLNAPYVDNSYKWAGGGFLSTTEDLARFGQVMMDGTLLKPATVKLLWTSMKTSDGKETGYGIGWGIDRDSTGRVWIGHTGGSMGGTAHLLMCPKERLVVAILVNSDETFISQGQRIGLKFLE
jgi:CubicO group peptidase (beta-lactamase class C family)